MMLRVCSDGLGAGAVRIELVDGDNEMEIQHFTRNLMVNMSADTITTVTLELLLHDGVDLDIDQCVAFDQSTGKRIDIDKLKAVKGQ